MIYEVKMKFYKALTSILVLLLSVYNFSYCNILDNFIFKGVYEVNQNIFNYLKVYYGNEKLYIINEARNPEYQISLYDVSDSIEYKFKLPDDIEFKGIESFIVSNDTLFFTDWETFHAFKFNKNSTEHLFSTTLPDSFNYLKKIGDIIYLFKSSVSSSGYLSHACTRVEKIKLKLGKQSSLVLPDPASVGFSFFGPTKIMDINQDYIAIADYDKYIIHFYDLDGNLIDSINYSCPMWKNQNSQTIIPFGEETTNAIKYMNKIRPLTAKINLIHRIDFVENNLIVCWSEPTNEELTYNLFFDIWAKKDNKWTIVTSANKGYDKNDTTNIRSASSFELIPQHYSIIGNYLIVFENMTTKDLFYQSLGSDERNYENLKNQYYKGKNNFKSIVAIYEINF